MGFEQERENVALNWETMDPADVQRFLSVTVPGRIESLANDVGRLHGRIEGLESALSEADATITRLTSTSDRHKTQARAMAKIADRAESSRAELAREVETQGRMARAAQREHEQAESENAALRAALEEIRDEAGTHTVACEQEPTRGWGRVFDVARAALGAGKETQP